MDWLNFRKISSNFCEKESFEWNRKLVTQTLERVTPSWKKEFAEDELF